MRKKIIIILLLIIVLGAGYFFIQKRNTAQQAMTESTAVKMVTAESGSLTTTVSADGAVSAQEEKDVKAKLMGIVEEVYVESGDKINVGDLIFKLDDNELQESLETARLTLEESNRNYQSLLTTYNQQGDINNLKLKDAQDNLEIALVSLENDQISLQDQKDTADENLKQAKEDLKKADQKLTESKHLYDNNAITMKALEEAREAYQQAEDKYNRLENELEILVNKTIPNTLKLARLKVENARNQLNLLKASIEQDNITTNDLQLARIKVVKAENQVDMIKEKLTKITTISPINGTIISLEINEGDKVAEGATVGKVADIDQLIVEAMVDEVDINEIKLNQPVNITSDAFTDTLSGRISWIAPVGTKVGNINKYKTEIEVVDSKGLIRPGMFVNSEIITNQLDDGIILPTMAVLGEKDNYLFIVKEGKVEKREVEIGLKNLSRVEVKGVKAGEKVVIGPFTALKNLKPGMPVRNIDQQESRK